MILQDAFYYVKKYPAWTVLNSLTYGTEGSKNCPASEVPLFCGKHCQ